MSHSTLAELLGLESAPIAISFVDSPPPGVRRVPQSEPASCGYWRRAAAGEVFYTTPDDHKGCPIGAHTHHVPLSAAEQEELMGLVQTMVGLSYLTLEDVAQIPRRSTPLQAAVYSPLDLATVTPDVVLVWANARQLMLLAEATQSAGLAGDGPSLGRPTCAVVPQSINLAKTAASFGCVGNRIYTGISENEAYFAIPGSQLETVERTLATIVRANNELETFHRTRAATPR